ncbi:DUF6242 domain-containing protein [Tamlana sp. I1]|uniref:DUF6242 domain-containing protein n=1 Tax=Tamlana sp. I1 TaxID=2762061 RepID=UPI0018901EE3|nr:DUF6242 domain-containing protein [Tamlana sp. I1]
MKTNQKLKYLFSLVILSGLLLTTSCSKDDEPASNLTGFTSFGFTNDLIKDYPFTVDNTNFVIKNTDSLPYQFDASALIAQFSVISGSKVDIAGVSQTSGVTVNDFSNDVTYTVTAEDGVTERTYTVEVNIAQTNPEGVQWSQKSPNAFDNTFETQEYFYLNGKHWVVLGKRFVWFQTSPESKLYSSTDGISWTEETPTGDFPVGYDHNIVVANNKAYVVGYISGVDTWGADQPTLEKNLFTTEDGISWTKSEDALDVARIYSPGYNVDETIYAFAGNLQGGFGSFTNARPIGAPFYPPAGISPSTLVSTNGTSFTPSADYSAEMPKRVYGAGYVYEGKMYVAGGIGADGFPLNDVWSSTDGVTWSLVSEGAFTARRGSSAVTYDGKVWLFGGQLEDGQVSTDMLVSEDGGVTFSPVPADQLLPSNYKARLNADISVDADGNLWIIGGETVTDVTYSDEGYVDAITYEVLTDVWSGKLNKL